jgi:hypothetical protein
VYDCRSFSLPSLSAGCTRQAPQPRLPAHPIPADLGILPPADDSAIAATRDSLRRELPRREAQWAAHRIANYRLAVRLLCYCPAPPLAVVTVRRDSIMVRNALGQPLSAAYTEALAFTIPKLCAERAATQVLACRPSFIRRMDSRRSSTFQDRATGHVGYLAVIEPFEVLDDASPSTKPRQN